MRSVAIIKRGPVRVGVSVLFSGSVLRSFEVGGVRRSKEKKKYYCVLFHVYIRTLSMDMGMCI